MKNEKKNFLQMIIFFKVLILVVILACVKIYTVQEGMRNDIYYMKYRYTMKILNIGKLGQTLKIEEDRNQFTISPINHQYDSNWIKYTVKPKEDINKNFEKDMAILKEKQRLAKIQKRIDNFYDLLNGKSVSGEMNFVCSFYTDLPEENGGWSDITTTGCKLNRGGSVGIVATNYDVPIHTKIHIDLTNITGYSLYEVCDRMDANIAYNRQSDKHRIALDVFVARRSGESKDSYLRRVNSYGVKYVVGVIKTPK